MIKPTEWGEVKTDAINFSQPFLWFDDTIYILRKGKYWCVKMSWLTR